MKRLFNQFGVIKILPVLAIVASVGIISFLLLSSTASFKNNIFNFLFQKPFSHAAISINIGDWPQLGHDAQKTNASPEGVNGPYRFYWRWTQVPFASRAQPVIFNKVLYMGSTNGTFYAVDAVSDNKGRQPNIVWQKTLNIYDPNLNLGNTTTADPVRAGAGVDTSNNTVIVGTQHGTIYGLDTLTGNTKWTSFTGGAILGAPLLDENGLAYIGSADGYFYSINTSTGAINWKTPVTDANNRPAPILSSAALSTDGNEVFFVAENVKGYALNSSTGAVNWSVQLTGQGGADRWPVVLGTEVVFETQQLRVEPDLLHEGDCVLFGGSGTTCSGNTTPVTPIAPSLWQSDWESIKPNIVNFLTSNPDRQSTYIFDTTTGQSKGIPPILWTFGFGSAMSMPVVYNNNYYLRYRPRHGIQNDGGVGGSPTIHVSSKYDDEFGMMDPATFDIQALTTQDAFITQYRSTSDEASVPTIAGNMLIIDTWERLGAIQLTGPTSGSLVGIAQQLDHNVSTNPPCEDPGGGVGLMPFYEHCPLVAPPAADEGNPHSGAVEGAGRIFWRPNPGGMAAIGPANNITNPPQPLASSAPISSVGPYPTPVANPSITTLQSYVWNVTPQVSPALAPLDLTQKLNQEVQAVVSANQHLLPFFTEPNNYGAGSYPPDTTNPPEPANIMLNKSFWYDPAELVYSLSISYPYLNTTLQGQVKTYIQQEMARYSPLVALPFGGAWPTTGKPRESYPISNAFRVANANSWPPPAPSLQTLYALWAYANNTGDWNYISNNWTTIQNLFYSKTTPASSTTLSNTSIDSYAEIAGAIGYARLAQHLGNTTEATAGRDAAVAAMQTGLNYTNWINLANTMYPPDSRASAMLPGMRAPVFFGLVPEVGQYLHDTNKAAVDYTLNYTIGYNRYNTLIGNPTFTAGGCYLWYVTHLGELCEAGERSYQSPEIAWSVFLTQAYVEQLNQQQLRFFLDRPWGLGDPWYLQKVVATIQAPSSPGSTPFPSASIIPTISPTSTPIPIGGAGKALQFLTNLPAVTGSTNEGVDFGKTMPGLGNTFTVETNFYYTGDSGDQFGTKYDIILSRQAFGCEDWAFGLYGDKALVHITHDGLHGSPTAVNLTSPYVFSQNAWHHMAMTGDGTTFRLYVDGVMVSSAPQGGAVFDSTTQVNSCDVNTQYPLNVFMGRRSVLFNNGSFHGIIDEARISNIARYTGTSFTVPSAAFTSDGNTTALWHLDEGTGATTADSSGHGFNGTLVHDTTTNGPTWVAGYPFSGGSTCPKGPLGDIDCDGTIGIFDYNILLGNFNKIGTGILGDINNSGKVDIFDYNILVTNFGK